MVERQSLPSELELFRWLDGVGVVIAQNAGAVLVVERQAVADAMGTIVGDYYCVFQPIVDAVSG